MIYCILCGNEVLRPRFQIGYVTCLECGEKEARKVKHTVVPMHKSNYMLVTDRSLIPGMCSKTNFTHGKG